MNLMTRTGNYWSWLSFVVRKLRKVHDCQNVDRITIEGSVAIRSTRLSGGAIDNSRESCDLRSKTRKNSKMARKSMGKFFGCKRRAGTPRKRRQIEVIRSYKAYCGFAATSAQANYGHDRAASLL
jgi:hypothetical protein